jgi:hypothetical protein
MGSSIGNQYFCFQSVELLNGRGSGSEVGLHNFVLYVSSWEEVTLFLILIKRQNPFSLLNGPKKKAPETGSYPFSGAEELQSFRKRR